MVFCSGPGQTYVFSVFIDSIISETGLSRTGISTLYMTSTAISAAMVIMVSRMADRFGPRIMLVAIGFAFTAAAFGMATATNSVLLYVAFASLRALGQGSIQVNAILLVNQWFISRRGLGIALMGLGGVISTAVYPPMARALIDQIGWREAYAVLGILSMGLIVPTAFLVIRNRPEDMGLYPDGKPEPPLLESRRLGAGAEVRGDRKVFGSLTFWLLAIPLAVPGLVSTALVFHQTSIFEEQGLSATLAAGVFVIYAVSAALSSMVSGLVVGRTGPKALTGFALLMLLVGLILALVMDSVFTATLYVLVMGISAGTHQLVQGVTWAHYYGRQGLGRLQGSAMMLNIVGSAAGPFPLAMFHQWTGTYTMGIAAMTALPVLSLILLSLACPSTQFRTTSTEPDPQHGSQAG